MGYLSLFSMVVLMTRKNVFEMNAGPNRSKMNKSTEAKEAERKQKVSFLSSI